MLCLQIFRTKYLNLPLKWAKLICLAHVSTIIERSICVGYQLASYRNRYMCMCMCMCATYIVCTANIAQTRRGSCFIKDFTISRLNVVLLFYLFCVCVCVCVCAGICMCILTPKVFMSRNQQFMVRSLSYGFAFNLKYWCILCANRAEQWKRRRSRLEIDGTL